MIDWCELPVFTRPETVGIVLDSWRHLREIEGMRLYGYVIMENHLHFVAQSEDLIGTVTRFKSFTARCLIDHLTDRSADFLLKRLSFAKRAHKADRSYQFWQEGSHPELIGDETIMRQKLEYIHRNPVKRGYVDQAEHWRYSSARNYSGEEGLIDVDRWF